MRIKAGVESRSTDDSLRIEYEKSGLNRYVSEQVPHLLFGILARWYSDLGRRFGRLLKKAFWLV